METTDAFAAARDIVKRLRYLEYLDNVLYYDRWAGGSPSGGFAYGSEVNGFVVRQRSELLCSKTTKSVVEELRGVSEGEASKEDLCVARWLQARYDEATKVPSQLLEELSSANAQGQREWAECLERKDFKAFLPTLERQFDVQRRIALSIDPDARVYDTIMARCDPSYTCDEVDALCEAVKEEVLRLLPGALDAFSDTDALGLAPIEEVVSEDEADALVSLVCESLGADPAQTTRWRIHHPVTVCVGPRDGRPSTYPWGDAGLFQSMRAMAHETGHSMYGCGSSQRVVDLGLWGGIEGFMHESQSRFYENHVFRSEEFWEGFLPKAQKLCPKLAGLEPQAVCKMLNKPKPGPSRLSADELTYPLHIIVRHEIERDYFDGRLALADIEEAWNAKYKEYLGCAPEDASQGVLSDVHWASGCVGYFFSYALGDLYAAQFEHALRLDAPDAFARLSQGDSSEIKGWLSGHVWASGQSLSAPSTLRRATGEDLDARYYCEYLARRYE